MKHNKDNAIIHSDPGSLERSGFESRTLILLSPTQECPFFHAENLAEQLKTVTKAREELSLALALEKGRRQELDQWRQQAEERRRQDLEQWRQETEARSKSLSQAVKVCLAVLQCY